MPYISQPGARKVILTSKNVGSVANVIAASAFRHGTPQGASLSLSLNQSIAPPSISRNAHYPQATAYTHEVRGLSRRQTQSLVHPSRSSSPPFLLLVSMPCSLSVSLYDEPQPRTEDNGHAQRDDSSHDLPINPSLRSRTVLSRLHPRV